MSDPQPAGRGTTVTMAIRLNQKVSNKSAKKIITVSIVDDEADLREHIAGYLAAAGNAV